MWNPQHLTTLWASMACYRDSFTFYLHEMTHQLWLKNTSMQTQFKSQFPTSGVLTQMHHTYFFGVIRAYHPPPKLINVFYGGNIKLAYFELFWFVVYNDASAWTIFHFKISFWGCSLYSGKYSTSFSWLKNIITYILTHIYASNPNNTEQKTFLQPFFYGQLQLPHMDTLSTLQVVLMLPHSTAGTGTFQLVHRMRVLKGSIQYKSYKTDYIFQAAPNVYLVLQWVYSDLIWYFQSEFRRSKNCLHVKYVLKGHSSNRSSLETDWLVTLWFGNKLAPHGP
jgi:hypothetical protein